MKIKVKANDWIYFSQKRNKDAGEGEKGIKNITEGKRVEMEIRFVKPMRTSASISMDTESLSDPDSYRDQTKVTWSNAGTLKYPVNIFVPMMERMPPKEMDESLVNLKGILEKNN